MARGEWSNRIHEGMRRPRRDIPLRFLVHFVGDMHQPLHLTGRDRGGNNGGSGRGMLWDLDRRRSRGSHVLVRRPS